MLAKQVREVRAIRLTDKHPAPSSGYVFLMVLPPSLEGQTQGTADLTQPLEPSGPQMHQVIRACGNSGLQELELSPGDPFYILNQSHGHLSKLFTVYSSILSIFFLFPCQFEYLSH